MLIDEFHVTTQLLQRKSSLCFTQGNRNNTCVETKAKLKLKSPGTKWPKSVNKKLSFTGTTRLTKIISFA